jgi:carboxymethylenebutenolidase
MPIVNSKPDTEMMSDFDSTVAFAKTTGKADTAKLGITGFCRGGRTVLMYAAHNPQQKAAVAWYGPPGGKPSEFTRVTQWMSRVKSKCRCWAFTAPRTQAFRSTRSRSFLPPSSRGHPAEVVVYPDAGHGFHADFRADNYRKADAEDAWKKMLDWFRKYWRCLTASPRDEINSGLGSVARLTG